MQILTVSQVNRFIKSLLEGEKRLNPLLVTGEISNFTDHYRSGHLYFSLKEEGALLKAVMFSGAARTLKFRPQEGMKIIARGRISLYEPSGQYQLYVEDMQPDGVGALAAAYQQLKDRLQEEGLFDIQQKRPLPRYPRKIGVVTSPTGAAVQDILQITARRWPVAEIVLFPVLVQGEEAPAQLINALRELNRERACDVIILGRGGGSLEDLWAFNNEELAREVFASEIPVVSAVGHETDFTICDFAADLRAPTPSAAAELCTPDLQEELERLASYWEYFGKEAANRLAVLRQSLDILTSGSPLGAPLAWLEQYKDALSAKQEALQDASKQLLEKAQSQLALRTAALDALSPLRVLHRGYAVVTGKGEETVKSVSQVTPGEVINVHVADGNFQAQVTETQTCRKGE